MTSLLLQTCSRLSGDFGSKDSLAGTQRQELQSPRKEDHAWSSTQAGGWTWFSTASGNAGASGGLSKYMSLPLLHGLILHPTLECLRKGWKSIERLIASDVPARTVALEPDTPAWFQHDDSDEFYVV